MSYVMRPISQLIKKLISVQFNQILRYHSKFIGQTKKHATATKI
jgi:hypothetical protein